MGHGMNAYDLKRKRAMRRRNHVARDLADIKYHQRVKQSKKKYSDYDMDDFLDGYLEK